MRIELLIASAEPDLRWRFDDADGIHCRTVPWHQVLAAARSAATDVVLLDCRAREDEALDLLEFLRQEMPAAAVLLLVQGPLEALEVEAVRAGARGCLRGSSPTPLWVKAVSTVHAGESWFSRHAMWHMLTAQNGRPLAAMAAGSAEALTPREREILELIGTGLSNKEIARRLAISDKTVKTHLHRTYVKLHQSGRYKAYLAHPPQPPQLPG